MYVEYFLPALGSNGSDGITDVCRFKDLPKKKITHTVERAKSDFSMNYGVDDAIKTVDEADFLIEDDDEDF